MSGPSTVWINGKLEAGDAGLLTVTDRGFQVGDGIFETLRVVGGQILEFPLHLHRLRDSAAVLAIPLPDDLEVRLGRAIEDLCEANGLEGADTKVAVRVTVSRGPVQGRSLRPPEDVAPNVVVQAWEVDPPTPELLARGLALVISQVRRNPASPLARVKTTSRAEFVYAQLEAKRQGADERAVFDHPWPHCGGDFGQLVHRRGKGTGDTVARLRDSCEHDPGVGPDLGCAGPWTKGAPGPSDA